MIETRDKTIFLIILSFPQICAVVLVKIISYRNYRPSSRLVQNDINVSLGRSPTEAHSRQPQLPWDSHDNCNPMMGGNDSLRKILTLEGND